MFLNLLPLRPPCRGRGAQVHGDGGQDVLRRRHRAPEPRQSLVGAELAIIAARLFLEVCFLSGGFANLHGALAPQLPAAFGPF